MQSTMLQSFQLPLTRIALLQVEMCLAVKVVNGEVGWHDLPCSEKHPVVCEEADYA